MGNYGVAERNGNGRRQQRGSGARDFFATGERDNYRGPNCDIQCGGDGHGANDVSMEHERRGNRWRDFIFLHNAV